MQLSWKRTMTLIWLLTISFCLLSHIVSCKSIKNPNIALNKMAQQSSTFGNNVADFGVNGDNVNIKLCSQSENRDAWHWWMVDLNGTYTIESVRITSFYKKQYALRDLTIEVSSQNPSKLNKFPQRTNASVCLTIPPGVPNANTLAYACDNPTTGRYVRVVKQNKNKKALIICEFEVYTYIEQNVTHNFLPSANNIALNKPVRSSNYEKNPAPLKIVDGNLTGSYNNGDCIRTHPKDKIHWFLVDLQLPYDIESVRLLNRIECCQNRLENFSIEISMNDPTTAAGFPGKTQAPVCVHQIDQIHYPSPVTIQCDSPLKGRYVRMLKMGILLNLCEIEVFGKVALQNTQKKDCKGTRMGSVSLSISEWHLTHRTTQENIDGHTEFGLKSQTTLQFAQKHAILCALKRSQMFSNAEETHPYMLVHSVSGACQFLRTADAAGVTNGRASDWQWIIFKRMSN